MKIKNTALAAVAFVIFYNILFFHTLLGIATPILFFALNIYFFFTRDKQSKNLNFAEGSSILSILFSFLFAYRQSEIIQTLDLVTAIFFSLLAVYFYKIENQLILTIVDFLLTPFKVLFASIQGFFNLFKQESWATEKSTENNISRSVIRGAAITIPIFGILLFLLVQADPIFNKYTQDILKNSGERIVISTIIFFILMGFGLAKLFHKTKEQSEIKIASGKSHELAIITGSVIFLFASFILIQFRYLFLGVGERELSQLGIASLTYSEYVRKGFFELLIASSIASGVIIYVLRYLHYLSGKQKQVVQIFSAVLTVETGLLLLSAVKRVALYADAHGLTRARVFGFIFLIWLSLLLIIIFVRLFKEFKKEWFFYSTVLVTLFAFLIMNIVNIDGLIADQYKPTVNDEIDYYYLTNLSTDAAASWKPAIEDSKRIISQLQLVSNLSADDNRKIYWTKFTLDDLNYNIGNLIDKYGSKQEILDWPRNGTVDWIETLKNTGLFPDNVLQQRKWQSLNLSEYAAYKQVSDNFAYYKQLYGYINQINDLQAKVNPDVIQNTQLDRSTQAPLTQ